MCATGGVHTLRVARTFSLHFFPCVTYRHEHAWLKVFAVRMSFLSISPFPLSCFIRHPCCSRTVTSTPRSRLHLPCRTVPIRKHGSSALPHERRGVWLPDRSHAVHRFEPKEFDKITSADGDTTLINDQNYDNISDFSKITRENTGLFGVPSMFEASVSHVSYGEFPLQGESKDSVHRKPIARQREIERPCFIECWSSLGSACSPPRCLR